ncbi:MAG: hypothetical protein ABIO70_22335 [Pseudomonadota bacterium]
MIRIAVLASILLAVACSQAATPAAPAAPVVSPAAAAAAPAPAPPAAAVSATAEARDALPPAQNILLFFLNPNGYPCQVQHGILEGMGAALTDKVTVQYVSIEDPTSRGALYTYGVRALPALIEVDPAGKELHRFSPGIHEAADILAALQ